MRDVPPVTCMVTRVARLGKPERRDPIACPKRALPPLPWVATPRPTLLGYGQQPPCAPVAPSRLAQRGAQSASVRCAFEPKILTTSRNADIPYGSLWKPTIINRFGVPPPVRPTSQIGWVHDFIKIILISYCMIDNEFPTCVICFGPKS